MKKNFKERLKASIFRTIVGCLVIYWGIKFGRYGVNWQQWTSQNSDLGAVLVMLTYIGSAIMIIYGVYLISPIYISIILHNLINWSFSRTMLNYPSEEEIEGHEENERIFRRKIKKLLRQYLW